MTEPLGSLSFVSWVRQGLATAIPRIDQDPSAPTGALTTSLVVVNFAESTLNPAPATNPTKLTLVGPGDIVGLHPDVVCRIWPKANDNDAEYLHLASIEFDQADLPWRYTPASASLTTNQLRPWMTLLVLKDGEGTLMPPTPSVKLPNLAIKSPSAAILPDLTKAWGWAHTQFVGTDGQSLTPDDLGRAIRGAPGQFVARIVSPRVLEPSTSYTAYLVPTFQRGVLIGTGQAQQVTDSSPDALAPAWDLSSLSSLVLPVYFYWQFQTGTVGSFEQLAKLIQPQALPAGLGRRIIDMSSPGLALPSPVKSASPQTMQIEGAIQSLQSFNAGASPWSPTDEQAWVAAIQNFLNAPQFTLPNGRMVNVVAPPLYGRWYAMQNQLSASPNPPWFFTLNADPRPRVAGGLGSVVVQNNQQALMTAAWNQAGDLKRINLRLKVAQLGREITSRLSLRHVVTGSADTFWTLTASLHAFASCGGHTMCTQFGASPVGNWLFDPAWRRVARPLSHQGRFQGWPQLAAGTTRNIVSRLNSGQNLDPEPDAPSGLFTPDVIFSRLCFEGLTPADVALLTGLGPDLLLFWGLVIIYAARQLIVTQNGQCYWQALRLLRFGIYLIWIADGIATSGTSPGDVTRRLDFCAGDLSCNDVTSAPKAPNFAPVATLPSAIPLPPVFGATDTSDAAAFRTAFCAVAQPQSGIPTLTPPSPIPDLGACQISFEQGIDPQVTVQLRFANTVNLDPTFAATWKPKDPLEPIFAPPAYQYPMYLPLAAVSKDWVLPGVNDIGRNTAGLGLTNQHFIEAYMVGVNQEMARELLWNEFPTDQRSTYFRQFWDVSGVVPPQGSTINPEKLRDILPIASWSTGASLGQNSARDASTNQNGNERLVLVVRAQLIQRYPNVIVYALQGQQQSDGSVVLGTLEKHPMFYGNLDPDVAFYGFDIALSDAGSVPGWFFVLAEHPTEPKFQGALPGAPTPVPAGTSTPGGTTGGALAASAFEEPFRIAIHGSVLLPLPS